MSDIAVEVNHVWKRFHRGEIHDSLRDLVPALAKRVFGRARKRDELGEGDFWALRDVDFQVKRGEVLGIIGANGAGKSTLLKILARILRPNRGSIRVNGRLRALIEIAAGFHQDLTGRENIYLNGTILGMRRREIAAKFDEIVEFSGIGPFLDTPVKRYSSGMYARLGFAVAAHLEPEILVVDEVLAVGDAAFQRRCLGRMEQVAGEGRSVLFVSHNMAAVQNLCSRCLLLHGGAIQAQGPSCEVVPKYLSVSDSLPSCCDLTEASIQRTGTGDAVFQRVELLSLERNHVSAIPAGDGIVVRMLVRAQSATVDAAVGVGLFNDHGLRICGLNSQDLRRWGLNLSSGEQTLVELRVPRMNLSPSQYTVNLLIRGSDGRILDHVERAISFRVVEADVFGTGRLPRGHNVIFLDGTWSTARCD